MIKKTITYTDFNGNERTEELYFNMTKSELAKFALQKMPSDMVEGIDKNADPDSIDLEAAGAKMLEKLGGAGYFEFIENLVLAAYGVKSEDGRRFIKDPKVTEEFRQTQAYDDFLIQILNDEAEQTAFINGVIPAEALQQATKNKALPVK